MPAPVIIHWFRQDLRIGDNPALFEAAGCGRVLPVFILDSVHSGEHAPGAVSRWWLHHSLQDLDRQLNGALCCFKGDPLEILPRLARDSGAVRVHWNRCYEPWRVKRDARIKTLLQEGGVEVRSYNGSLLWEPWDILKKDGTPYKVFTPYHQNGCLESEPPRKPLLRPKQMELVGQSSGPDDDLELLPGLQWHRKLEAHWNIGEEAAHQSLHKFLQYGMTGYREKRDFPALRNVSRLSPHLHWGELSANQVWYAAACLDRNEDVEYFHRELCWREFSNYLLYHFPDLTCSNFNRRFDRFPWNENTELLKHWQLGRTGIPIVDAGMRELWETGYMHNRVRMIVASFLTKNLLLHWKHGQEWFADCLVDANLASNCTSWQWVAGCGADAAPYFRIFNPVVQGRKFDPTGDYIFRHVPELKSLPVQYLFNPWEAPAPVLKCAGITLGETYPHPIVDLNESRERALKAYETIKA